MSDNVIESESSQKEEVIFLRNALKKKNISPDELSKRIWALSKGCHRNGSIYKHPIRLFRSRIFKSLPLPSETREFSYPLTVKRGRANSEDKPVFYASAGGPTTFVESRCAVDDIVVVSEFRTSGSLTVQVIGFDSDRPAELTYEGLIREIFTKEGEEFYPYSSVIAEHLMMGGEIQGLLYPSIVSQNNSQNFALKTSFVDNSLNFVNATAYRVSAIPDKHKYTVNEIDFGVCHEGSILWKGRKKQWELKDSEVRFVSTGWSYDSYTMQGDLIDPV